MNKEREYITLRDEANTTKKFVFERTFIIAAITIAVLNFHTLYTLMIPISLVTLFMNYWFIIYRIKSHARIVGYTKVFLENEDDYFGWETYLEKHRSLDKSQWNEVKDNHKNVKNHFVFGITFYHIALMLLILVYSIFDYINTTKADILIRSDLDLSKEQLVKILSILFGVTKEIKSFSIPINIMICILMFGYVIKVYALDKINRRNLCEIDIAEWIRNNTLKPWRRVRDLNE